MIPDEFTGYFTAASTAAGALIGLLAIAISVRPEAVLAAPGPPAARAIAASAFTALVNSFFVSLIALIPGTRLGYIAARSLPGAPPRPCLGPLPPLPWAPSPPLADGGHPCSASRPGKIICR